MSEIKANEACELNEQKLKDVHGGQNFAKHDGEYYEYVGGGWPGSSDWDKAYRKDGTMNYCRFACGASSYRLNILSALP